MKVTFKKTAIDDMLGTERYIAERLHNPTAARKLTASLYGAAMQLSEQPYLGAALAGKYPVETDLRYLIVAKHLIFYRVAGEECIEVTRVLDGRQDYMSILF